MCVLALAAAACGGNDTTTPRSGGTTPAATSSPITDKGTKDVSGMTTFELELDDKYFSSPTFMKVKSGQILKIELKNEGSLEHNFTVTSLGINKDLEPGSSMDVTLTFPASGTDLAFFCEYHVTQGMRGAFFFGESPAAAPAGGGTGYGSGYGG